MLLYLACDVQEERVRETERALNAPRAGSRPPGVKRRSFGLRIDHVRDLDGRSKCPFRLPATLFRRVTAYDALGLRWPRAAPFRKKEAAVIRINGTVVPRAMRTFTANFDCGQ